MMVERSGNEVIIKPMLAILNAPAPLSPFGLGAETEGIIEELPPIQIDQDLAETMLSSVARIDQAASEDAGAALEPCWRVLRIAKWGRISLLQRRLRAFLASNTESLVISENEFKLMDEVLACALTLSEGAEEEFRSTLETVGIVIGIAGGLATLVVTVF